jgi:telomere length regulation protein
MADFLTAVSTKKTISTPVVQKIQDLSIQDAALIDSAQSALQALKSEPSHETIFNVLDYLNSSTISLIISEPVYASVAHELINNVIPNFWEVLKKRTKDAQKFATVLRNPTGIGHIVTRLRSLIAESRQSKAPGTTRSISGFLEDTLDVLGRVLSGDGVSYSIWTEIQTFGKNEVQKKLMWREFLAQVASGRVLSVRAEAEDVMRAEGIPTLRSGGDDFAEWLGRNVVHMLTIRDKSAACMTAMVEFSSKVLTLGYTGEFTQMKLNRFH